MPDNQWEQWAVELQQSGEIPAVKQLERPAGAEPNPNPPPVPGQWEEWAQELRVAGEIEGEGFVSVRPEIQETASQKYLTGLTSTMKPEHLGLPPRDQWAGLEPMGFGATLKDEWTGQNLIRKIPLVGLGDDIGEAGAAIVAMNRLKEEMAGKIPEGFTRGEWMLERNAHIQFLRGIQIKSDFAEAQGYEFLGKVASVVSQLPTFMAEMWLASPLAKGAQAGIGRLGVGVTGGLAKRFAVKAGVWGLQKAVGASIRTGTALIGRAINDSLQNQLPDTITVNDKGQVEFEGGDEAGVAWAKGFASTWIEALSEDLGSDIGKLGRMGKIQALRKLSPATRRAIKPFLSPLKTLQKNWLKARPGKTSNDFAKALFGDVGFDGTIEEMLEERAGGIMRAITGAEDITLAQAIFPGWEALAVEAVSFSVPGALRQGAALASAVKSKEEGASDRTRALAAKVAAESDDPKMRGFAEKVDSQLKAGEIPEEGLMNRVIEAGENLEQAEQGLAPEEAELAFIKDLEAEAAKLAEPTPFDTAATLVQAVEVPAKAEAPPAPVVSRETVESKPKPAPVAAKPAPVKKEAPAEIVSAVEASEFAKEQAQDVAEAGELEQEVMVTGKDVGLRVLASRASAKQDVGSTYVVRHKDFEEDIPLEQLLAAQIAEPDQSIGSLVSFLQEVKADAGPEIVARALGQFKQDAPQTWKKRGKKLLDNLDLQPDLGPLSGQLPLEMVEPEFKRLRKLLTPGLAKQIMRDVTFWKEGLPINVTPKKLAAFAERAQFKPKRAVFLGQVSKQMEDKQLKEWAKAVLPARAHKMIASALDRIINSRTPGERDKVIDAVNRMVEKHDKAVALEKVRKQLKDVRKSGLSEDNKDRLESLMEDLASTKPKPKSVKRAESVMDAALKQINAQVEAGIPADEIFISIPVQAIDKARAVLARAGKTPLTDLSAEDLKALSEGIEAIVKQNATKNKLLAKNARGTISDAAEAASVQIENRNGAKFGNQRTMTRMQKIRGRFRAAASWMWENALGRIYRLAGDTKSAAYDILWEARRQADEVVERLYTKAYDGFRKALQSSGISGKDIRVMSAIFGGSTAKISTNFGRGREHDMSPDERIDLYLNLMDPGTRSKIISGEGVNLVGSREKIDLTFEEAQDFVQNQLTTSEKRIGNVMSAVLNGSRAIQQIAGVDEDGVGEALNRTWKKVFGYSVASIQNYWPRTTINDADVKDPNKFFQQWQTRFLEQQNIFQERQGGKGAVRIGSAFAKFDRTLRQMSAAAGRMEASHDAMRLITNPTFEKAVESAFLDGQQHLREMKKDLLEWVSPARGDQSAFERGLSSVLRSLQVGTLFTSLRVVAYQTLSLANAAVEIPLKYMTNKGLLKVSNKQTRSEIEEWSALGWARIRGTGQNIITPFSGPSRMAQELSVLTKTEYLQEKAMALIHGADTQVMYRIWRGAKLWAQDDGFTGDALMRETARRFRTTVERTQPSWDTGTLSGFQRLARKTPLAKLIPGVMFSSQRNQNANMTIRATSDWAATGFSARAMPKAMAKISVPTLMNAVGIAMISGLWVTLLSGVPDDPEERQKRIAAFYMDVLRRFFGNWIVGGDVVSTVLKAIEAGATGKPAFYADTPDNILETGVNDAMAALYYVTKAVSEEDPDKMEKHRNKALLSIARGIGRPIGLTGIMNDIKKLEKRFGDDN